MAARQENCDICRDPRALAIDASLVQTSLRLVGRKFGLSIRKLHDHKRAGHLETKAMIVARERERQEAIERRTSDTFAMIRGTAVEVEPPALETPEDVLTAARGLYHRILEAMARAELLGDQRAVMQAAKEARATLEFIGRVYGMFGDGSVSVNVDARSVNVDAGITEDSMRRFLADFRSGRTAPALATDGVA